MDRTERFSILVARADSELPLDEVAALIAAHAYPQLDPAGPLAELDRLAGQVREPTLDGITRLLFGDLGFVGNRDDYYDPRNSYINDVLDRRIGIPITLALVTIEVGRRLAVPIDGVGMPGHFLVRDRVDRSLFIDVFNAGARIDSAGCERLYEASTGGAGFRAEFLEPISRIAMVDRMLANLEQIQRLRADLNALTWVLELRVLMPLADAARWSALGIASSARGQHDRAAAAFLEASRRSEGDAAIGFEARSRQAQARLN